MAVLPWLFVLLFVFAIFACLYVVGSTVERFDECTVIERIPTKNGIIEIVNDECKEGLPHTTDSNTIRMTRAKYTNGNLEKLLVHERVHLDQKRNPEKWLDFYKRQWDYEVFQESPLPAIYTQRLRPNPDTALNPWSIWRNRYVFFPYAEEGTKLGDAVVKVWDIAEHKFVAVPDQWKARFCDVNGCPHQYEHPHEISAEFLTKRPNSFAAKQVLEWYQKTNKSTM